MKTVESKMPNCHLCQKKREKGNLYYLSRKIDSEMTTHSLQVGYKNNKFSTS